MGTVQEKVEGRPDRHTYVNDDVDYECDHPLCTVVVPVGELIYRRRLEDFWYCSKLCRERHIRIDVQKRRRANAVTSKHDNFKRIERKYGVSRKEWERLHDEQLGRCAVCQTVLALVTKVCVDHDHETGRVRGLLCSPCNTAIGLFGDDPVRMRAAAKYVSDWAVAPAQTVRG